MQTYKLNDGRLATVWTSEHEARKAAVLELAAHKMSLPVYDAAIGMTPNMLCVAAITANGRIAYYL